MVHFKEGFSLRGSNNMGINGNAVLLSIRLENSCNWVVLWKNIISTNGGHSYMNVTNAASITKAKFVRFDKDLKKKHLFAKNIFRLRIMIFSFRFHPARRHTLRVIHTRWKYNLLQSLKTTPLRLKKKKQRTSSLFQYQINCLEYNVSTSVETAPIQSHQTKQILSNPSTWNINKMKSKPNTNMGTHTHTNAFAGDNIDWV